MDLMTTTGGKVKHRRAQLDEADRAELLHALLRLFDPKAAHG